MEVQIQLKKKKKKKKGDWEKKTSRVQFDRGCVVAFMIIIIFHFLARLPRFQVNNNNNTKKKELFLLLWKRKRITVVFSFSCDLHFFARVYF